MVTGYENEQRPCLRAELIFVLKPISTADFLQKVKVQEAQDRQIASKLIRNSGCTVRDKGFSHK
jgi:hypothetical protein